jgi:thiamine biosynthesis lipoprotein ApbE
MGTSLELRVQADRVEAARWAEDRVLATIDRLAAILSGYDPASEFSRWQSAASAQGVVPAPVSPELFEILQACDSWRDRSGGAFDPRVQAFTNLWTRCAAENRTPTPQELAAERARLRWPAWRLDPGARTAQRLGDCPLTFNAIAKGWIVERACQDAYAPVRGIHGVVLNVGGDLRVLGETAQTVGIASPTEDSESTEPFTLIEVRDRVVATSGRIHRGLRINGRWYSHIFDPRTGHPAEAIASATVIAERSADADALATILNVLAPEESLRLVRTLPGVDCLIVTADGRVVRSEGWQRYERPRASPIALAQAQAPTAPDAPANPWGRDFELLVDFEINRPEAEAGRYRRPFVAIWVEDKKGFPVRNVALWVSLGGPGPWEWMKDLKRWYLSDQIRKRVDRRDMVLTMSRPTRPPGKYSVIWDGKDDHGKLLDRGEYTLFIDAAREHGTYQSIRTEVTLGDAPFTTELEGNIEIKSATITFRRKAPNP